MHQPYPDKNNIKCNDAALDWLKKQQAKPIRDHNMCSFGDWLCPRLATGCWLCGSLPNRANKKIYKHYPYWIVYGIFTDDLRMKRAVQLPLIPFKFVWGGIYHCVRGALWAEAKEKELGAIDTRIVRVDGPQKSKRKLMDFSNVINLGCEK